MAYLYMKTSKLSIVHPGIPIASTNDKIKYSDENEKRLAETTTSCDNISTSMNDKEISIESICEKECINENIESCKQIKNSPDESLNEKEFLDFLVEVMSENSDIDSINSEVRDGENVLILIMLAAVMKYHQTPRVTYLPKILTNYR